jgi:hypothetical protein
MKTRLGANNSRSLPKKESYMAMKKLVLPLLPALCFSLNVSAEEAPSYPTISGELSLELQNDLTYDSDDKASEINDLYPTVVLSTKVAFTQSLSINLEATVEPVQDATDDRAFEDIGGYVNILTVNYDTDLFSLYAGKFTPNFGIAWDAAPGLYGADLSEDYELAEMIGLGGALNFSAAGYHTVSVSSFFKDTSFFSDSVGDSRGPLDKKDGGAGNTEKLNSFAIALDGNFTAVDGLRYHLGFSSLAEGDDGTDRQNGFATGADYQFNVTDTISATPLIEYVYLDNNGGIDGDTAHYLSAGVGFEYGAWNASAMYQRRDTETGGTDVDDYVADLSVGYTFENGIGIAGGWRFAEEGNIDNQGLGLLVSYAIEF